jgi:hypothetical protein
MNVNSLDSGTRDGAREVAHATHGRWRAIAGLCRTDAAYRVQRFERPVRALSTDLAVIVLGAGIYGATIGLWRSPLQAVFTAVKFPLLMILTTGANALLNGMLAQLLGLRIGFRQSVLAIISSFAVIAVVLASLSPVTLFFLHNTPPLSAETRVLAHNFTLLMHVGMIGFAGIMGNVSLFRYLAHICGERRLAGRVLAAWLIGNLFLGAQLSWIMRPFIGSPGLPVQFFRPNAFEGNFYESVLRSLVNILTA